MNRAERVGLVEREGGELPLSVQAELLRLNRSGLYYRPVEPSAEEIALKHRIDELYTAHPIYGSRKITAQLRRDGLVVNRKAVQRHMREMGIVGICPGPNLSRRNLQHRVYPYLLSDISASYANHIWGIDITYIRMRRGWVYLVAILDWFSRYVVAWELDLTLELGFVLSTIDRALASAVPAIVNSDQGSQFTSAEYIDRLQAAKVQSQDQLDNAQTAADSLRAKIALATQQVSAADARINEAQQAVDNCTIQAPFTGIVVSKDAQVGESVRAALGERFA